MGHFNDKVALVTGGTLGLGRATALAFAGEGAKVVIAARREDPGRELEASIRAAGGEATFVRCDVREEEQVKALVERTLEKYQRLDFAYNSAGMMMPCAPIADLESSDFDFVNSIYLRSMFLCMKYELRAMLTGGGGAIVNCSSIATLTAKPTLGHYTAAKAGVEAISRVAANEYAAKNIRVNVVCAGPFDTPLAKEACADTPKEALDAFIAKIPVGRLGHADELAQTVLFLCSPAAAFITGASLVIDGGLSLALT